MIALLKFDEYLLYQTCFKQKYLSNYQYDLILKQVSNYNDHLVWDKDDEEAMDFVAACSNIRSKIFGISQKTRFDIKSMAGNEFDKCLETETDKRNLEGNEYL